MSQPASLGEFKGVVAKVKANDKANGIHLLTSSEEYLEIKVTIISCASSFYMILLMFYVKMSAAKAEEMLKVIQSTMLRQ